MDEVFQRLKFGRFQLRLTLILGVYVGVLLGAHTMIMSFTTDIPPKYSLCNRPDDKMCERVVVPPTDCITPARYESEKHSVATEWGADACSTSSLGIGYVNSMFFLGCMIGVSSGGLVADRYGRRFAVGVSFGLASLGSVLCSLSWDIMSYGTFRWVMGLATGYLGICSVVLNAEMVPAEWRRGVVIIQGLGFSAGGCFVVAISLLLDWRMLSLFFALVTLPSIFVLFTEYSPESPRWYVTHGQPADARAVLLRIAEINGIALHPSELNCVEEKNGESSPAPLSPSPSPMGASSYTSPTVCSVDDSRGDLTPEFERDAGDSSGFTGGITKPPPQSESLWDVMTYLPLAYRLVSMISVWFACSTVYYGLSLSASNLGSSVHLTLFFTYLLESPAIVIAVWLTEQPWSGRRGMTAFPLILSGVFCVSCAAFPQGTPLVTLLALAGRFCASGSFAVAYLYGSELFPTSVRTSALGMESMAARVAGILVPAIVSQSVKFPLFPFVYFGFWSCLAGLLSLSLPETLGRSLDDTIAEVREAAAGGRAGGARVIVPETIGKTGHRHPINPRKYVKVADEGEREEGVF